MTRSMDSARAETEAVEACRRRLSEAPPSPTRLLLLADLALASVGAAKSAPNHRAALKCLIDDEPPPFATPLYGTWLAEAAQNPNWTAIDLIFGAQADRAAADDLHARSQNHGSRAAEAFARMAQARAAAVGQGVDLVATAFPAAVPPALHVQLKTLERRAPPANDPPREALPFPGLAEAVMLHLSDLRTACRGFALGAAARGHAPSSARSRCRRLVSRLSTTRLRLVAASARLVDDALEAASGVTRDAIAEAARRHIRATAEAPIDYTYHQRFGAYP